MSIELRAVTADDWAEWRVVRLAALADAPGAFGSPYADWTEASEARWRDRLSIPGSLDLIAFDGERVVGMASGVPGEVPGRAELISMWVAPEARRRGVARAVISAIAAWATGSFDVLGLTVMPDNAGAQTVYERNGFVLSDEPGPALPDGRHELVMVRDLTEHRS